MIKAPALRPGDVVGVAAPASSFRRDWFERGIAELRALGFLPRWDDGLFARARYLAGSAERRAAELQVLFADPDVRAIFCARGGYGSAQVIPLLDSSLVARDPKPVVGCSDVTSLLIYLTGARGLVSFHGPMVAGQLAGEHGGYDRASLLASLTAGAPRDLDTSSVEPIRRGEASGRLIGGCLSQLAAAAGTPYALRGDDLVLFIEDVNERPYRLDRLFTQLAHAGSLAGVRGLIFGEMPDCGEPGRGDRTAARDAAEERRAIRDFLAELVADFPGPVAFGLPSGHTVRPAQTLPLGVSCRLYCASDHVSLALLEGAVG